MSFLENLNWRYATKKFDINKKVSEENLEKIKNAIRYAPSSMGVQMYQVVEVVDKDLREKLREASFNQKQVVEADRLFIFLSRNDVENRIDEMLHSMSDGDAEKRKSFTSFEESVRNFLNSKGKEEVNSWSEKNAGIALGFGLAACAELGIDSCPMDGFEPNKVKELLNLNDNFLPIIYLAVGYRDESDETIQRKKWRFPEDKIFRKI